MLVMGRKKMNKMLTRVKLPCNLRLGSLYNGQVKGSALAMPMERKKEMESKEEAKNRKMRKSMLITPRRHLNIFDKNVNPDFPVFLNLVS